MKDLLFDAKSELLDHIWGYCALDMYKDAINECKKLIRLDPKDASSFIELGLCYEDQGKIERAVKWYRYVIRRFPESPRAYINLGYIFETYKTRNDMAIVCYEKALEVDPKDEWALNNIGSILQKEGKWKDAISYYEKACEVIKQDDKVSCCQISHNLAWAYYRCKYYKKACHIYKYLTKENPCNASVYSDFGCVNYKLGRYRRALNLFKKALLIRPDNKHYRRLYQVTEKRINAAGYNLQHGII